MLFLGYSIKWKKNLLKRNDTHGGMEIVSVIVMTVLNLRNFILTQLSIYTQLRPVVPYRLGFNFCFFGPDRGKNILGYFNLFWDSGVIRRNMDLCFPSLFYRPRLSFLLVNPPRSDNEHSPAATGPKITFIENWATLSIIVYNKLR